MGSAITLQVPGVRPQVAGLTVRIRGAGELHPPPGLNRGTQAPRTIFPDRAPVGSVSFRRSILVLSRRGQSGRELAGARWARRRSSIAFAPTRNDAAPDFGIVIRSASVLGVSLGELSSCNTALGYQVTLAAVAAYHHDDGFRSRGERA